MDAPTITVETVTWTQLDARVAELQADGWDVAAESTEIDGITAGYMAAKLGDDSYFVSYHFLNVLPD